MATSAEARRYQAYAARIRDAWRHGRLDAGQTRRLEAAGFEFEPRRLSGVVRIEDGRRFDTLKAAHDETGGPWAGSAWRPEARSHGVAAPAARTGFPPDAGMRWTNKAAAGCRGL